MKNLTITPLFKQRGVSKLGLISVFLMIVAFLSIGLKVGPLYLDDNFVTSYCETLLESGEAANLTTTTLRNRVSDNLRINNVQDFDLTAIRLSRENGEPVITIDYERRVPLFLNLDAVAVFNTVLK